MFYHGIKRVYVYENYPILSPRKSVSGKTKEQLLDRRHLIEEFGLEPIHLLEDSESFPQDRCIQECLAFGDIVFAFDALHSPLWQLSRHEVGVTTLDLRLARRIFVTKKEKKLKELIPEIDAILLTL